MAAAPTNLTYSPLLKIGMVAAPTNLTYGTLPMLAMQGVLLIPNSPASDGGLVVSYGVSPAFPTGIGLDTTTGVISGKCWEVTPLDTYTVTATNGTGTDTVDIDLEVIAKRNDLLTTFPICEEFQADPFVSTSNKNIVGTPPSIISPDSLTDTPDTRNVIESATIVIEADGVMGSLPMTYQWYKNGVVIGGATAKRYTYTGVANQTGAIFTCLVSNAFGAVFTNPITMTVGDTPNITGQPASLTRVVPATATFTVTTTGDLPQTHQWKKGGVNVSTGTGGTTASYTTAATTMGNDQDSYTCVITNASGSATTNAAILTMHAVIVFNTQPQSIGIGTGTSTILTATISAGSNPTYLWEQTTTPFSVWITAVGGSGGTTLSYTTPNLTAETRYRCAGTNGAGTVNSSVASVTIV